MEEDRTRLFSRRKLLKAAGMCVAGAGAARLGLISIPGRDFDDFGVLRSPLDGEAGSQAGGQSGASQERYAPPSEENGGWRTGDPAALGLDAGLLEEALDYHDQSMVTTSPSLPGGGPGGGVVSGRKASAGTSQRRVCDRLRFGS